MRTAVDGDMEAIYSLVKQLEYKIPCFMVFPLLLDDSKDFQCVRNDQPRSPSPMLIVSSITNLIFYHAASLILKPFLQAHDQRRYHADLNVLQVQTIRRKNMPIKLT